MTIILLLEVFIIGFLIGFIIAIVVAMREIKKSSAEWQEVCRMWEQHCLEIRKQK